MSGAWKTNLLAAKESLRRGFLALSQDPVWETGSERRSRCIFRNSISVSCVLARVIAVNPRRGCL